jgi:hypothetical protein
MHSRSRSITVSRPGCLISRSLTYDPLVAAFFAAGAEPSPSSPQIAVWCVDLQAVRMAASDSVNQVEIITVSRLQNKNLAAQKGLFFMGRYNWNTEIGSIEETIDGWLGARQQCATLSGPAAVQVFRLQRNEAPALRDSLRKQGIDRAHLMPSFDGVVHELRWRQSTRLLTIERLRQILLEDPGLSPDANG